jgi:hypothetical protein
MSYFMIFKDIEMFDGQYMAVNSIVCLYVIGSVVLNVTKVEYLVLQL